MKKLLPIWTCLLLRFFSISLIFTIFLSSSAQIINGDFKQSSISCNKAPLFWKSSTYIQVADNFQTGNNWIDITGCNFGNGNWIEQNVRTTPGMYYKIQLDLGTWWGWGIEDAGVDISINGNPFGSRYFNDSFSKSLTDNLHWETITTCEFLATSNYTNIRFTGHGLCSKFSPPTACTAPNPGVIAVDNIHFSDSMMIDVDTTFCTQTDTAVLGFKTTGNMHYTAVWFLNGDSISTGKTCKVYAKGDYTLKIKTGCNSQITKTILFNYAGYSNSYVLCAGDTLKIGTNIYDKSGDYKDTLIGLNACDTIVNIHISVIPKSYIMNYVSICQGNYLKVGKNLYNTEGTYNDTFRNFLMCDSIVTTHLHVNNPSYRYFKDSICRGDSFVFHNNTYFEPAFFYDTILSYTGCDSILEHELTFRSEWECNCSKLGKPVNVFTPNGDGINDYFPDYYMPGMSLWVYDRWGILAYYCDNGYGWNGTIRNSEFPPGTYYYLIEFNDCNQSHIKSNGVVTLIR